MIEIYSWPTPNGHKVHILLEEIGCDYSVIPINIRKGDQFARNQSHQSQLQDSGDGRQRWPWRIADLDLQSRARSLCILPRRAVVSCRGKCASATKSSSG